MKRGILGIALLVLLLTGGLLSSRHMEQHHSATAMTVRNAGLLARTDRGEEAVTLARQAAGEWHSGWEISAALASHSILEEVDSLFAELETYAQTGQNLPFAALCARLACRIEAVNDAHELSLRNLL